MKKHFLSFAAICVALCACEKVGSEGVLPEINESSDSQAIALSSNLLSSELLTKASIDQWDSQILHIVGYDITKIGTATAIDSSNGFVIPDSTGTAPAGGVNPGRLTFNNGKVFYYEEGVKAYDFNGFYAGDNDSAVSTPLYMDNGMMKVGLTIDGSQDILGATTNKDADRVIADSICSIYGIPVGSKVNKDYVYSAYAARRGVQPKLNFEHMLSKFTFTVKLGGNAELSSFHVDTIAITAKENGTLFLNPVDATSGNKINSYVQADADSDSTMMYLNCSNIVFPDHTTAVPVEGCIMVIPEETEYTMTLTFHQDGTDGQQHSLTTPISISKVQFIDPQSQSDAFKAGKQYQVNLTVYGLEEIIVNVNLTDWEHVGNVNYDPDDIPGAIE